MKVSELNERISTPELVKDGKLAKIEFYVSTGDKFAERFVEFIKELESLTTMGASRSVGILDDSSMENIKLFIDGDGADSIRDVKLIKE